MDTRGIAAILLKVTGLVLIGLCVTQLPAYLPARLQGSDWSPSAALLAAAITLGPIILLGLCLWFFPGTIANKIVTGASDQPAFEHRDIQLIAMTVLGLYLIAHGITDLIYHVTTIVQLYRQSRDNVPAPATIVGGIAASAVEVVLGAVFCVGAKGTLRFIERLRG